MKRQILKDLVIWKKSEDKKALIILGARQVGKTYIVREFAREYYENIIEINFEFDLSAHAIFNGDLNLKDIIMKLSFLKEGMQIKKGETLIFLDEIQACPRAVVALKLFADNSGFDVIASGSMLGVSLNHISSYPVGYVETLILYPFNFIEFLWANNVDDLIIDNIKKCFENKSPVDEFIHKKMNDLFLKYVIVGGMPATVKAFIETIDFSRVIEIQKQIIDDYRSDMAKYASKIIKERVKDCYDSIPDQLAKNNKKFQYKLIQQGGNARHFGNSIAWICDSGIAYKVHRLKTTEIPLKAYRDLNVYKLYLNDTGLLLSMYEESMYNEILNGKLDVFKGGIFENVIFQTLIQNTHNIYYYEKGQTEIDFVITLNNIVVPIEVKSGYNTKSKSLKLFIESNHIKRAIKLSLNNVNCNNDIIECYPLYMTVFIK